MKTKEELNALKNEVKNLNKKLAELTDEELAEVSGGVEPRDISGAHVFEPVDLILKPVREPAGWTKFFNHE